jgi:hypothetical protein
VLGTLLVSVTEEKGVVNSSDVTVIGCDVPVMVVELNNNSSIDELLSSPRVIVIASWLVVVGLLSSGAVVETVIKEVVLSIELVVVVKTCVVDASIGLISSAGDEESSSVVEEIKNVVKVWEESVGASVV